MEIASRMRGHIFGIFDVWMGLAGPGWAAPGRLVRVVLAGEWEDAEGRRSGAGRGGSGAATLEQGQARRNGASAVPT